MKAGEKKIDLQELVYRRGAYITDVAFTRNSSCVLTEYVP
jgi:hypothetical protein